MIKKIQKYICRILSLSLFCSAVVSTPIPAFSAPQKALKITVGSGSGYDYATIQEAVDSINYVPTKQTKAIISIAKGTYEEVVNVSTPFVCFENADSTNPEDVIITFDRAASHENPEKKFGTQQSATVTIDKDAVGFESKNVTFQNSYNLNQPNLGEDGKREQTQAVALVSLADKVVFENCNFLGRQDTLYLKGASIGQDVYGQANPARIYLKDCYIEGTVDYIFGDATAFFDNCHLNVAYYKNGGHYTAANTTLFNIGYVFSNCKLTVDESYENYKGENAKNIDLGRPWQGDESYPNYGSHTAFINCQMPDYLLKDGWSEWNSSTITNKIRYMEYGSVDESGKPLNLDKRIKWSKILTAEQAQTYTAYNVLKGEDNCNPSNSKTESAKVLDVTLNKYSLKIPMGESDSVKAFVLPVESSNKNVSYKSEDEKIASVDNKGKITGFSQGKTKISAITQDGAFSSSCDVEVLPPRTIAPKVSNISLNKTTDIYPGDILNIDYLYALKTDSKIDNAKVQWFVVNNNNEEFLIQEGRNSFFKTYNVDSADVGSKIKCVIIPETVTSYGNIGEAASVITEVVKAPSGNYAKALIRDSFSNFESRSCDVSENVTNNIDWITSNSLSDEGGTISWKVIDADGNSTVAGGITESCLLEYNPKGEKGFLNTTTEIRMKFNPLVGGFSATSYFNLLTGYNKENGSYYKLSIMRGSNTNSLKLYLYKKADSSSEEVLLASDEESLNNKVAQNSGENNPWFRVKESILDGKIKIEFILEGDSSPIATLSAEDSSPIKEGVVAFANFGKTAVILLDSICVKENLAAAKNEAPVKVYLAGDSTVKTYGKGRTTGGWGEYLQSFFDENKVEIINTAEGGRSTRSFINQGRLAQISDSIKAGDYLFIQFGHNDSSDGEDYLLERYAPLGAPDANGIFPYEAAEKTQTPQELLDLNTSMPYSETFYPYTSGTFKWYLREYVKTAKEKGAIPVLVTPVSRMYFNEDGTIKPHHGEDDGYVAAVKQVAKDENVPVLDLFSVTKAYYEKIGARKAELLHDTKADAATDKTHYSKYGGYVVGEMVAQEIKKLNIDLGKYEIKSTLNIEPTENLKNGVAYLVGDSTVCLYDEDEAYSIPRGGWGMFLADYLIDNITVSDLALSGRSSKSFTTEDNYQQLLNNISEGDYLFIQFGHNDAKNTKDEDRELRYTDPDGDKETEGSFKYYLYEYYIKPAKDKKAQPILVTPVSRRSFDDEGKVKDTHARYDDAVLELAQECQIPYIDLTKLTEESYNSLGIEGTKSLHSVYKDNTKGENGLDNTHFSHSGAKTVAKLVVNALPSSESTIKNYIDYKALSAPEYMTRADFIVGLIRIMGIEEKSNSSFNDVDSGKYYANSIGIAKDLGLVSGDSNNNVRPEEYITRQDMMLICAKALKLQPANPAELDKFADASYISGYAKTALASAVKFGIISGTKNNKIEPAAYASVSQGYVVLEKAYEYLYNK